ncbi:DUF2303 family protein [Actinobaculum sp. 352]|uniref:DUF2303 family protein n=1 Tax=Actinobaculum sp. 352 TaxID=2490946 RepID=UPI000F7DB6A7|nr:DUF2303 family protein [Actinobaculum sp. 352]RTE47912.1 DUF2303 family protein [Actinobaculum sp. 352]
MEYHYDKNEVTVEPGQNLVETIHGLANRAVAAQKLDLDAAYAVTDENGQVRLVDTHELKTNIDSYEKKQVREKAKHGSLAVHSPQSFVDYLATHAMDGTEIWADVEHGKVTAIIDAYDGDSRGLRQHRVSLQLIHTDTWKEWEALDREYVRQAQLGDFIVDHYSEFVTPSAAKMLQHAMTFQATKNVDFTSVENVQNGERSISYIETIGEKQVAGQSSLPEQITFRTQIFEHGQLRMMYARWFFTIKDKTLLMKLLIDDVRETKRDEFRSICETIENGLDNIAADISFYYGTAPVINIY